MRSRFRFGRFELLPVERQLLDDGRSVVLGSRAFDLLEALIERRDRLVGKSELLDLVWPGLVVEEANLTVQISALRKLIGSKAIATIPGRGYRFAATPGSDELVASSSIAMHRTASNNGAASTAHIAFPEPPIALCGRDDDLPALVAAMQGNRMVTVVGAGGIGKTALALAAARDPEIDCRDGACWVDLTSIGSPALVAVTIAQSLQLRVGGGDGAMAALIAGVRSLELLLVLDNAEHVIEAVAQIARRILSECAGVRLLVTSQIPSRVDSERLFRLEALEVPIQGVRAGTALAIGSVAMFVGQCKAMDRRFELDDGNVGIVVNLCRHLDGLPLAIKLAAARLPLLGLHGLEARLGDRLKLLAVDGSTMPSRQRTLLATLEWSHSLLSARDQRVFRRLAVFVGGFTLELATEVAGDATLDEWAVIDSLSVLVDRALVVADSRDEPRYKLLETTRDYAMRCLLISEELDATQLRHASAVTKFFEAADDSFWEWPDMRWLAKYVPELGNVRAAMDWCAARDSSLGVALVGSVGGLYVLLGLHQEYRSRSGAVEPPPNSEVSPEILARYWMTRSISLWSADHRSMLAYARRAESLYRTLNDPRGLGMALCCAASSWLVPQDDSVRLLAELASLDRRSWPPRLRAWLRDAEFQVLFCEGRFAELLRGATHLLDRQAVEAPGKAAGLFLSWIENWIVVADLDLGCVDRAIQRAREVVMWERKHNRRHITCAFALNNLARGLVRQGSLDEARAVLEELFDCCRVSGWHGFGIFSDLCTLLALREGRLRDAACLIGFADAAWERIGRPPGASVRFRARAIASLKADMDIVALEGLIELGSQMDEESVCALTLATASSAQVYCESRK